MGKRINRTVYAVEDYINLMKDVYLITIKPKKDFKTKQIKLNAYTQN